MSKLKKRILLIGIFLIGAIGIAAAGGGYYAYRTNPKAEIVGIKVLTDPIFIGEVIRVEITTKLPWYRRLSDDVGCDPPDGLQVISGVHRELSSVGFGIWQWTSILELQAYDFGPFTDVTATVSITPDKNNQDNRLQINIPELKIKMRLNEQDTDLSTAAELTESFLKQKRSKYSRWVVAGVVLLAVVIITAMILNRRKSTKTVVPPKPWVVAESSIFKLEERLPLDANTVFVELTDIVRRYLEAAYMIPATERTTPEFLQEINWDGSQLSADHRSVLADFLTAADMVKFAKLDASQGQIDDAIGKAKRFIIGTSEALIAMDSVTADSSGTPGRRT